MTNKISKPKAESSKGDCERRGMFIIIMDWIFIIGVVVLGYMLMKYKD